MINKQRYFLLKKSMTSSWMLVRSSCKMRRKGYQVEREDYQTGLQNAIMQFQRQYNLRNQKVPSNPSKGNPPKGNPTKEAQSNIPSSSQPKKDFCKGFCCKGVVDKGKKKEEPQKKILEARKETVTKEVEKPHPPLILKVRWLRLKFMYHSMN
jgi:hypothetical protein